MSATTRAEHERARKAVDGVFRVPKTPSTSQTA